MKIAKVEAIPVTIPFVQEFTTSRGKWFNDYVIVRLTTDSGLVGVGDGGVPMPRHYGESQGSVMEFVHNWFAPKLLGEDPFCIQKHIRMMDEISCWQRIAKSAIDYALYDIIGKALETPVYNLLGGLSRDRVALGWMMAARPVNESIKEAQEALHAGFHSLKMKVGLDSPKNDVERVLAVRKSIGDEVPLMVDANQAWAPETAIRTIRKMEEAGLTLVEQPTPDWDLFGLIRVRNAVSVPIMADEVARSIQELANVIRADAADFVTLHISKVGGLFRSLQYVSIAEAANMPVVCGMMLGGGIETAAAAHFTTAVEWMGKMDHHCIGSLMIFGGFDTRHIKEDIVYGQPARIEGGHLYPPSEPGLGVELNEEMVSKYLTKGKDVLTRTVSGI